MSEEINKVKDIIGEIKIIKSEHFIAYEYKRISQVHGVVYETLLTFHDVGAKITREGSITEILMSHITSDNVRDTTTIEYHTPNKNHRATNECLKKEEKEDEENEKKEA
jgi:hypothetical protein